MTLFCRFLLIVLVAGLPQSAVAAVPVLSSTMETDPMLPSPPTARVVPAEWKKLWVAALGAGEEDLRRQAAAAIMEEHQLHAPGLEDTKPALRQALQNSRLTAVQLTIAAALIELDAADTAALLFELTGDRQIAPAMVVEPPLARWDHLPARELWLERLAHPESVPRQLLLLAIEGLGTTGENRAVDPLSELTLDRTVSATLRIPAAAALGKLRSSGLTEMARELAGDKSARGVTNRILAGTLLSGHDDPPAQALLLELAEDEQPAVAAIALRRLLEIDPSLVQPLVNRLLGNPDATVRRLAAQSLVDRPSPDVFGTLGGLLDDSHPDVRVYVRESLQTLAGDERFDSIVRQRGMDLLEIESWYGLEQAARLLGELDHKPAANRLVELLDFDRPEVIVTAAWALRELAVRDTLPGMLEFVHRTTDRFPRQPGSFEGGPLTPEHDVCLSHIFEAFGQMRFMEPEPILRKFVPRRYDLGPRSRGAAVWALGLLYENNAPDELIQELAYRLIDEGTMPQPEAVEVRASAAISLGRFGDSRALQALNPMLNANPEGSWICEACRWAIEQITGEDLPDPRPRQTVATDPFLRSVDSQN